MKNLKKDLQALGVDYENSLERFLGKTDFYEEFLFLFLEDTQVHNLTVAMKEQNAKKAFKAAHTLKGLCSNLGFQNLLRPIVPLVEILRNESFTNTEPLMADLTQQYQTLCTVLENHKNGQSSQT